MLSHLLIKNYALIDQIELTPPGGLTIITGETGAGKSILLGAIGLLMGNRADVKALYDTTSKCVIEGTFDVSGYAIENIFEEEQLDFSPHCIIRREISPSGKSRAFVNDTPVTLDILKRVSDCLLDIHSQHDSILLGNNDFQLDIIDTYAGTAPLLKTFRSAFQNYKTADHTYQSLLSESIRLKKEFDYNNFLYQELADANLQEGEQETLENELAVLENAFEIKEKLQIAHGCLDNPEQSALSLLKESIAQLTQISRLTTHYNPLLERLQSALIELKDLASEVDDAFSLLEVNDERIELINERLNVLYHLQKKHQFSSLTELIALRNQLEQEVSRSLNMDEALENAKKEVDRTLEKMQVSASKLSEARKAVIDKLQEQVTIRIKELGIPNAEFSIQITPQAITRNGGDLVNFLFSANKGKAPQEIKHIASGGEFSRLMLVIKHLLATKRTLPTIIFDEIDTGISGEIAIKMGEMLLEMGKNHQIMAITHLHQIAAKGQNHYFVYKDHSSDKTRSTIKKLSTEERVIELAHMIGGHNPSESVLANARELLSELS